MDYFYKSQDAAIGRRRKAGLPLRRRPQCREDAKFTAAVTAPAPKAAFQPPTKPVGNDYPGEWVVDCGNFGAFVGYIKSRNGREVALLNARRLYSDPYRPAGLAVGRPITGGDIGPAVPLLILLDVTALLPLAPGVTLPQPE